MEHKSKVIVISSVSGGGKTSLIHLLVRNHPELAVAVTATSRQPRKGEINGDHYFFLSSEEFSRKIQQNEFLESAQVHGNYYGVPAAPVFETLENGKSVILNIDVQGMRSVKARMGGRLLSVFILPPDRETWEHRLRTRATDSEADIQKRLNEGLSEMKAAEEYDYRVVNEVLESAAGEISAILQAENIV